MAEKLRILVTGASGFVGQTLIKYLVGSGHEVVALSRRNNLALELRNICFDIVEADVTNLNISDDIFRDIDVVCHLAAYIPNNYLDISEAEKCYKVNALGTLNIASKSVANNIKRFIYVSTANMYSFSQELAFEMDPVFPVGVAAQYFVSKLAGEIYLSNICVNSSMDGVILRIGTPYGPGEPKNKLISSLLTRAMNGEELIVYHGGEPSYNFVYIEDIAYCIEKAVKVGDAGIYNVSSGESTTLRQVGETIATFFDNRQVKLLNSQPSLQIVKGFTPVSIKKAYKTWDFRPRTLSVGIHDYLVLLQGEIEKK